MRLHHIAYRVKDRNVAAKFFVDAFNYSIADSFEISFDDGSVAQCFALTPPEYIDGSELSRMVWWTKDNGSIIDVEAHIAPEIFVSEGTPDSKVGKWVEARDGIGGIHHIAYEVADVANHMHSWKSKGLAEFTTDEPIGSAETLLQCFTKPHPITGVVYEFLKMGEDNKGFNVDNVRDLMEST